MIKADLKISYTACVAPVFSESFFFPYLLLSLFHVSDFSQLCSNYLLSFDIYHVRSEQES